MIVSRINNFIAKKYPHFDKEEKRNVFVAYFLNLLLVVFVLPWVYIFYGFGFPSLVYLYTYLAIGLLLVLVGAIYIPVSFSVYRFFLSIATLTTVGLTAVALGRFSASIYGFYVIPMGMIMIFSRKEIKAFLAYQVLFFIVSYLVIDYTFTHPPLVTLTTEVLEKTNYNDLLNTMVLSSVLAYLYWNRNSITQFLLFDEQAKSDNLLLSIFPEEIARQLKGEKKSVVASFDNVTVIFADIVGFTKISENMEPQELVFMLDEIFSTFDKLADKHQVEKIKTIGDAYLAVSGLPIENPMHCQNIANFALEINEGLGKAFLEKYDIQLRIGIHTGRVVAGVIGQKKYSYDMWGKTVNTASRFESYGQAGKIHITKATKQILEKDYEVQYNGTIDIKGLGVRDSYFLGKRISN